MRWCAIGVAGRGRPQDVIRGVVILYEDFAPQDVIRGVAQFG